MRLQELVLEAGSDKGDNVIDAAHRFGKKKSQKTPYVPTVAWHPNHVSLARYSGHSLLRFGNLIARQRIFKAVRERLYQIEDEVLGNEMPNVDNVELVSVSVTPNFEEIIFHCIVHSSETTKEALEDAKTQADDALEQSLLYFVARMM